MSLSEVENGKIVTIKALKGGKRFVERLNSMGIYEGMKIRIVRHAPFCGPVLIQGLDSPIKVMIGYGMAQKIEVEVSYNICKN
jgi:Fe2+ transport system protein FeoA